MVIPLSGEMGEAQKVIPFLREMSRSDKRFADVLRSAPTIGKKNKEKTARTPPQSLT